MKTTSKALNLSRLCLVFGVWALADAGAAVIPAPDDQEEPAVVSNGNGYFAVWADKRTYSSTEYDIYGARISATGEVLDPAGIPISTRPTRANTPRVAFDGEKYLVVWEEGQIYGARVTTSGQVLDPNGFQITTNQVARTGPAVASDGRGFFVVWVDWPTNQGAIADIYGSPVSSDAVVANGSGIPLKLAPLWQTDPRIVSANGEYLVTYHDDYSIWGLRVSPEGALLSSAFRISSGLAEDRYGVASNGRDYFVVWGDERNSPSGFGWPKIYGTLVRSNGTVVSPEGVAIATNALSQNRPKIASDGNDFLVAWEEYYDINAQIPDIYAAKLTSDGSVGVPARIPVNGLPGMQFNVDVAFSPPYFLAVWQDGRSAGEQYYPYGAFDIYGTLYNPGAVISAEGFLISGALSNELPSITIQFPTNGAVFAAPANILILASVHDPDGAAAQARVEFFANDQSIGPGQLTDPGPLHDAAYRLFWTNVAAGNYTLTGRVTDEGGASSTSTPVTITVRSSNTNLATVSVAATTPDAVEGPISLAPIPANIGRFTFTREGNTNEPLAIYYSLSGTASNGVDYVRLNGVIGIPAGGRSAGLAVVPLDDPLVEGDETVVLALQTNLAYRVGSPATATVVIHDNDPVSTNQPPTVGIFWPTNGATFTAPALLLVETSIHDSDGPAASAVVEVFAGANRLGFAQLTDPGPLHEAHFRFVWTNPPPGEYTLTARATDVAGASGTSVPVTITIRDTNSTLATVSVVATTPDAFEAPIFVIASTTGDALLITNNPPILAPFNLGRFTITRDGNTNSSLAVYYSVSGTASNGVDYSRLNGTVGIPAGARSAVVVVVPVDDQLVEGDETVVLTLQANPAYRIGSPASATVVIHDNDPSTNQPPTVGIFWPTNGAVFIAPQRILIDASVEDPDGPAASAVVEIFANGNSLGLAQLTDPGPLHQAHFRFVWTNPLPGEYALTARATDVAGATANSSPVRIIIRSAPTAFPRLPMEPMSYASFVISANGILNAWGDNTWGELGYGWPSGVSYSPLRVPLPVGVAGWKIVASSGHTLAITADDQLYSWGANSQGQLGLGHTNQGIVPERVPLPNGVSGWIAVAAGGSHSVAISKEGQLYVWGGGKFPLHLQPTLVPPPDGVTRWVAVTAGQNHSLALADTGELYGWGENEVGQLGNGQIPVGFQPFLTLTIRPAGVLSWKQVVSGAAHTLAIADNNQLYGWGGNWVGQLGTGVAGNADLPVPVSVPTGVTGWSAIAGGQAHSFGIANDGRLFAWGANDHFQLGTGNTNLQSASTPTFVAPPAGVTGWQAVAAGYWHSVAVASDCQVYAWGWNAIGQAGFLGGGDFVPVPHLVSGLGDLCNPVPNILPTIGIAFPTNGASFTAPADITLLAFVGDPDGPAASARVEFFEGSYFIGFGHLTDPGPEHEAHFRFTWEGVPSGTYSLTAKVTDTFGASAISAPVHITVLPIPTNTIPFVTIRASDPEASEQNSDPAVFVVSRSPVSDRPLTVYYWIGGTASNGVDYLALSSPVVIPAGAASAEIVVRPIDDTLVEGTEVVLVGLTFPPFAPAVFPPLPPPYYLGEPNNAQVFIRDNDPPCLNGSNDCTIAQLCPCDNSWRNQAEYVRCVIQQAWRFFRAGLITADQRRAIIRDAILSNCGKHPAEPVCIHVLPLTPEECRRDGDQFVLSGDSTGACLVETSTDLVHWAPVQMDPVFIDGREVVCADPNPAPARFYRVRLGPVP